MRQYADAWASAVGQIKIATRDTDEAAAVTERLFAAAQGARAPFTELVQLYSRAARAGKELGTSQEELIKFSSNIGKALSIQGTSAEAAKGALLQLGQALGGGIVRAEEFNSIIEGAPYILQVVANNLDGAGGGSVAVVDDTAKAARIAQLMALAKQRKSEEDNSDLA